MYSKIIKVDIVFNHPVGKFPYGFKARLFPAVSISRGWFTMAVMGGWEFFARNKGWGSKEFGGGGL